MARRHRFPDTYFDSIATPPKAFRYTLLGSFGPVPTSRTSPRIHEARQARARRTRCQPYRFGDLAGTAPFIALQQTEYRPVPRVDAGLLHLGDELGVGLAVGGAHADVSAAPAPCPLDEMGP